MALSFGDLLSNAFHDIKQQTGKKISILQDEIGYAFDPPLSGDTIEKWRYRKTSLSTIQLASLAQAIISYQHPNHDREWLFNFLQKGGDPYPEAACERLFPSTQIIDEIKAAPDKLNTPTAPDLSAYRPPASSGFVGRIQEIDDYKNQLDSRNATAICGMAGIGKTSLAIEIAHAIDPKKPVFWHRFYDQNLNTLIRRLAGFLTHFGAHDLWDIIESARLAGVRPPDVTTCFDTLVVQLSDLDLLLCFDDLQFADGSQELIDFLRRLIEPNQEGKSSAVLITSRRFPNFLPADMRAELGGLSLPDTAQLLTDRGLNLQPDLLSKLHNVTEGNGAFLTLAAVVLQGTKNPAGMIERLATIEDIERFLLEEVNDRLSGQEQRVMEGIAVLSSYPGTRDVLEVMLNLRDVRRTLRMLADQHLLVTVDGENGREYGQHQIIQIFYYEQPSRQKRREMHRNAAEFYELEEIDRYKATLHYAKAGEADRAVQIAAEHLWEIVNEGMAASLLPILESIKAEGLEKDECFELWLAQGQLDSLLGDYENGKERFELAAKKLQELPETEQTNRLKGRVCLYMSELLERQDPPKALEWGQRGLSILKGENNELTAELNIQVGALMMNMGNSGGALEQFLASRDDVKIKNHSLRAKLENNLGIAYWYLGDLSSAIVHSNRALEISTKLRDHLQTARIFTNLGPIKYALEDWAGAVSDLENALVIASRLGSYQFKMGLHINLGRCYYCMGNNDKTVEHSNSGLQMADKIGSGAAVLAKINLAKHHLRVGNLIEAINLLETAEIQAQSDNAQLSLTGIKMIQAETLLAQSRTKQARAKLSSGLEKAQSLGDKQEQGIGWRLKGQLESADGNSVLANQAFQQSADILGTSDRYELALTQLEWGKSLIETGNEPEGYKLIRQAWQIFTKLGAVQDEQFAINLLAENRLPE